MSNVEFECVKCVVFRIVVLLSYTGIWRDEMERVTRRESERETEMQMWISELYFNIVTA